MAEATTAGAQRSRHGPGLGPTVAKPAGGAPSQRKPKLLEQMRDALRSRHYSRSTHKTYLMWVKRFIFFHNVRHPAEMAEPEINAFLTHLLESGYEIRTVQDPLGHNDVRTTMVYTHVLNHGGKRVKSPVDGL